MSYYEEEKGGVPMDWRPYVLFGIIAALAVIAGLNL